MSLRGLYARHLFPRLMEWALGNRTQLDLRREALAEARGRVLELGFGTGLNLEAYPTAVTELTAVDPERALEDRVRRRIAAAPFPVLRARANAARLPFREGSFDTLVSTWTLCTLPRPVEALREARLALAPGGRFLFMEHGLSDDAAVARWQDRLNPLERKVALGCHLNRAIGLLIERAGYRIERLERFRIPRAPRVLGEVYRGSAAPARGRLAGRTDVRAGGGAGRRATRPRERGRGGPPGRRRRAGGPPRAGG